MKRYACISLLILFCLALPLAPVEAAVPSIQLDNCAPGYQPWDFTAKIVDCVEVSIKDAVVDVMAAISDYMEPIMAAMVVLAIAFFGIRILGGEHDIMQRAWGLILRIGFAYYFFSNLDVYADAIFNIENQLLDLAAGGSPWVQIDAFIGRLTGVGPPPMDISKGLLGIIGAAMFSGTAAGILFFIAMSAFINLLLFIFRVVFTYLTAIMLIGFMIAISPMVIPMILFAQHTERFFNKWLDILISAMLVPFFLFAFLSIAVDGFGYLIDDIFFILCGNSCVTDPGTTDLSAYTKMNQPKFTWLMPSDPSLSLKLKNITGQDDVGSAAVQSNITPTLRHAHDVTSVSTPGVDFGPSNVVMLQKLIFAFLGLWIFASFMKSIVDKIPEVAYNITEAYSYISMEPSGIENTVCKGMRNMRNALTGWR